MGIVIVDDGADGQMIFILILDFLIGLSRGSCLIRFLIDLRERSTLIQSIQEIDDKPDGK